MSAGFIQAGPLLIVGLYSNQYIPVEPLGEDVRLHTGLRIEIVTGGIVAANEFNLQATLGFSHDDRDAGDCLEVHANLAFSVRALFDHQSLELIA